jgi:hypothetical protein
VQILDFIPKIKDERDKNRSPSELKEIGFNDKVTRDVFLSLLNSSLFYWLLTVYSDCRNLNRREIQAACFNVSAAEPELVAKLEHLAQDLMKDINAQSKQIKMNYQDLGTLSIQCTYPRLSKPIIDQIDCLLAQHYGFTDAELDFIINYDIKYRMGRGAGEEGE